MVKLNKKLLFIIIASVLALGVIGFVTIKIILGSRTELSRTGNEYYHNEDCFTQGLFFDDDGAMYESCGMYGESVFNGDINLSNGLARKKAKIDESVFLEGATFHKGKIYVLTWKEYKAYVYDKNLNLEKEMKYIRDGWGLTSNGKDLIASDGSSNIYFMDEDLKTKKIVRVFDENDKPVEGLNELEYINGLIFANIWQVDKIIAIEPNSGKVVKTYDFTDLYPEKRRTEKADVINGIAFNKKTNKVYITGKYWPRFYEFELK